MCLLKNVFVFVITCSCLTRIQAQESKNNNFDKKASFSEANDFFALKGTDGYYTNGTFIQFSKLARLKNAGVKKIWNWELGQQIFTPGIRETYVITEIDRPITGYLYSKLTIDHLTDKNTFYSYGVSVGTIGNNALGRQVLDLAHPPQKINSNFWDWIWRYQLKNEIGLNFHGAYAKPLLQYKQQSLYQITPKTEAIVGSSFTNLSQSVIFQIGKNNRLEESTLWGGDLKHTNTPALKKELFFFYKPILLYQLYNATVQGGMFRADKGDITSDPERFVFYNEIGVCATAKRFSASFTLTFQTKEAKMQENNHAYGKIQVGYKFR